MVVLEGVNMLSSNGNQYLQPDYLSPLPTTLDAKKSPLALLAQTCSQIGADSPPSKSLISPLEAKPKKTSTAEPSRTSPTSARDKPSDKAASRSSPPETKLAFKPYEANVITRNQSNESRPSSKSGDDERKSDTSNRKSASPAHSTTTTTPAPENGKSTPSDRKSTTPRGASPIIRSGLEILQGSKDTSMGYKPLSGLPAHSLLCCPPGLEHTNPAFRPAFPGAPFSHHHAAMLAGYPAGTPTPYLSYARVKTPSGGEALVPVCKDPYCTGCQFSMHNQQMLAAPCPSGCTQCDHQKYNLAMAMSLVPPPPGPPPSSLAYPQLGRPYICNWIAGDTYCGKRFVTSEELLQHLRTHTSGNESVTTSSSAAAAAAAAAASLLNAHSLFSTSALHRYPNPPLSPLSAARYHPYAKPGGVPAAAALAASPYSAFNPTTTTASLGPYYAPYSLYGQRLGAAVHP